ncbi:hypothetical protein ZOSMA_426G00040 [Zostera marina]|uniref:Helicase ATP-binding domain-containing protein n=1 Tax=Zostera marina TaxID=29655 RepID=A0A0K9P4J1_ZOSMR|nr:hypothetical protein ZOSMA_426G00040 [Zostera marina]
MFEELRIVLEADLANLDEIDSRLDIDALQDVAKAVNGLLTQKNSILMITHYQRLLDYIKPKYVHIMSFSVLRAASCETNKVPAMKFDIDDVTVYFPYSRIYPEQYQYMVDVKRALDARGHCVLEMSTGTGKTIALLSLIISYFLSKPQSHTKLLYCTRTVHEMEKTPAELRHFYTHLSLPPLSSLSVSPPTRISASTLMSCLLLQGTL